MSLNDLDCRHAKPKDKAYRLFDSSGLYLNVMPTGTRVWRYKYHYLGKEKLLTLGKYPKMTLVAAREKRDAAKELIENNVDPALKKQDEIKLAKFKASLTFQLIAEEWHQYYNDTWTPTYAKEILNRLKNHAFPDIGSIPAVAITPQHVLACLQKIEGNGRHDLTRRLQSLISQILRYAVRTGRADQDVTIYLKGALKKYKKGHHAAIKADQIPDLLKAIEKNERRLYRQTILAIRLMMLTFVRTNELIGAKWDEFDFKKKIWLVPAERMKMRIAHVVPLSKQSIAILNELKKLFGDKGYILPSVINSQKHISNNTILKALEKLGYHKTMTGHGFRSLAMSTIKEHLGYRHEVIDRQLAHQPRNKIDQAYDRAEFIPERTKMMQKWANYIDSVA